VIGKAKAGHDITIPITEEIAAALQMARDDAAASLALRLSRDTLVFPGCSQISAREALPARGNMLRHTIAPLPQILALTTCIIHFLMGHTPRGIFASSMSAVLILANGPAMRAAQERISARTLKELGLTFKTLRKRSPPGSPSLMREGRKSGEKR